LLRINRDSGSVPAQGVQNLDEVMGSVRCKHDGGHRAESNRNTRQRLGITGPREKP
jgi:hypothetical protein